jgi:SAM-dependent methyltransferase
MKEEINRLIYAKLLSPYLKESIKILDVGCSDAKNFKYLSRANSPFRYYGIDIDKDNLKKAKINNLYVIKADLENSFLPVKEKFDIIIITEVLEHLRSPSALIEQITGLLKEDGKVLISLPNEYNLLTRLRILLNCGLDDNALESRDKHIHFPTLSQSKRFIEKHFKIIKIKYWSSSGGRIELLLKVIPDTFFVSLANLIPSLFCRGVIFLCSKN